MYRLELDKLSTEESHSPSMQLHKKQQISCISIQDLHNRESPDSDKIAAHSDINSGTQFPKRPSLPPIKNRSSTIGDVDRKDVLFHGIHTENAERIRRIKESNSSVSDDDRLKQRVSDPHIMLPMSRSADRPLEDSITSRGKRSYHLSTPLDPLRDTQQLQYQTALALKSIAKEQHAKSPVRTSPHSVKNSSPTSTSTSPKPTKLLLKPKLSVPLLSVVNSMDEKTELETNTSTRAGNITARQAWAFIASALGQEMNDTYICEIVQTQHGPIERRLKDDELVDVSTARELVVKRKSMGDIDESEESDNGTLILKSVAGVPTPRSLMKNHSAPLEKKQVLDQKETRKLKQARTQNSLSESTNSQNSLNSRNDSLNESHNQHLIVSVTNAEGYEHDEFVMEREGDFNECFANPPQCGSPRAIPLGETTPIALLQSTQRGSLVLVQVFYADELDSLLFVTLAVQENCTAEDIVASVLGTNETEIDKTSEHFLCIVDTERLSDPQVVDFKSDAVTILNNETLIVPLFKSWETGHSNRFLVHEIPSVGAPQLLEKRKMKKRKKSDTILVDVSKPERTPIESENMWIGENELTFVSKISAGTFARVYKAIYKGKVVAVKILKGKMNEKTVREFAKEFAILKLTKHPNLVRFYGACFTTKLSLVMECCVRGTLVHVMMDPNVKYTWDMALNFGRQACEGLNFLHSFEPQIVHRDLKSLNLLVTKDWEIRISDFGLSRYNTVSNNTTLGNLCGTMSHCAPEIFLGDHFTTKSDVYSMAMILWEMATRVVTGTYKQPFIEYDWISFDFQIIIQTARNGLRPSFANGITQPIRDLISSCWNGDPSLRPNALSIANTLRLIQSTQKFK